MIIVGSAIMEPVTRTVIAHMEHEYEMAEPIERLNGTVTGYQEFCAGIGPQYPDIIAASHRMSRYEYDVCAENNIHDIIEVQIGKGALTVVTKKGGPVFNVTPRMIYLGIAEETPAKGGFVGNRNRSWKDTDEDAPDLPIQVIIPTKDSGTRTAFNDMFLEGGCRHIKEIDAIYSAKARVPKCITLREDGYVTELPEMGNAANVVAALDGAPDGTIAIVARETALINAARLQMLPVLGVLPTPQNITDDKYEAARVLRYYFKRAHILDRASQRGVVRGMYEFMEELVKDETSGDGGYLEQAGIVALDLEDHRRQQIVVRRLKRYEP
jgi:phosphate transport system substrate-binding protein